MHSRRIEFFVMFGLLLVVNFVTLLWLQGHPFATAWADGLTAPVSQAVGNIPTSFSYQGTLRNANGDLENRQVKITLRLYNVVTDGTALYNEVFNHVTVRDGLFSLVVGDAGTTIDPAIFENATLFLGIAVDDDAELLPRQRLHPVPWARQASVAQNAITATTALTAVNALNLVQGGGVPNLVSLGTGGASQIGFPANGGQITNSANGMIISGGGITKTVTISGNLNTLAIHEIGNAQGIIDQRSAYSVTVSRYVLEAVDGGMTSASSVKINDTILTEFCADVDGCTMTLGMRDWNGPTKPKGKLAYGQEYRFSLSEISSDTREYRLSLSPDVYVDHVDNDGTTISILNLWDCWIEDFPYVNGQPKPDNQLGLYLLNWRGDYNEKTMICVLVIED